MAGILDFCLNVFYTLSAAGSTLLEYVNTVVSIPGFGDYTVLDIVFGVGLTIYFGYAIIKYFIPL